MKKSRLPGGTEILGVDIGGTKVAALESEIVDGELIYQKSVTVLLSEATDSVGLFALLEQRLGRRLSAFAHICIAPAGVYHPDTRVVHHASEYYNLQLDLGAALASLGVDWSRVSVVNDFVAQAQAALSTPGQNALVILAGQADLGPIRVLGPGTGLGEAIWIPDGNGGRILHRSEGGNTPVPVALDWQADFVTWLSREFHGPARVEDILCGDGLYQIARYIYKFFDDRGRQSDFTGILDFKAISARRLVEAMDDLGKSFGPPNVSELVAAGDAEAVQLIFGAFLGLEVRSLCLKFWGDPGACGEVMLTGGVLRRCPALCQNPYFEQGFRTPYKLARGCYGEWRDSPIYHDTVCEQILVRLITDENAGAFGACRQAEQTLLSQMS